MNKLFADLGLSFPIIQSPMAGVQGSALTIAVSGAGGLGSLPCALLDLPSVRNEVTAIREQTSNPFNLNFFCHKVPTDYAQKEQVWRAALAPYYSELEIGESHPALSTVRSPFTPASVELIEKLLPEVVSFHFGLPSPDLLARVKASGAKIFSSATTVDEAIWLEEHGVDAVIAQGREAGGHRGMFLSSDLTTQVGTFSLLPQIVRSVCVPVIAAGGIADSRGVRAAFELGASAVQLGTAFLLCHEATTSELHRAALKSSASAHTAITNVFSGRPARSIMNRVVRELGPISDKTPPFPLAGEGLAPICALAEAQGRHDFTSLWCGQNATGCKEISAAELTRELAQGLLLT